ncbi:MobH family relaxase [Eoetvoesiella caeni]
MLHFLKKIRKLGSSKKSGVNTHATNLLEDVPRYPPFMKGLPVAEVEAVLNTQSELIGKIRNVLGFPPEEFTERVWPILLRYAGFVHLLPASEAHHHRGAGGLLRHGLEVAFWTAQSSEAQIFPYDGPPRKKSAHEARWRLAAFLAGLCHDVGKPVSDMDITDKEGRNVWRPRRESLFEWASTAETERYFLRWRDSRVHKNHERFTLLLFERIAGADTLEYLEELDPRVLPALQEAIGGTVGMSEPLTRLVLRADQESVKRDLSQNRININEQAYGVPVDRYVIDAIRTLIKDGTWEINVPGAKVWNLRNAGAFIVWKAAIKDLTKAIQEAGVPGVPRDADTLADVMLERGLAIKNEVVTDDGEVVEFRYWKIKPELPPSAVSLGDVSLVALRFSGLDLIFAGDIPSEINGQIEDEEPTATPAIPTQSSVANQPAPRTAGKSTNKTKTAKTKSEISSQEIQSPAKQTSSDNPVQMVEAGVMTPELPAQAPPQEEEKEQLPPNFDEMMALLKQTELHVKVDSPEPVAIPESDNLAAAESTQVEHEQVTHSEPTTAQEKVSAPPSFEPVEPSSAIGMVNDTIGTLTSNQAQDKKLAESANHSLDLFTTLTTSPAAGGQFEGRGEPQAAARLYALLTHLGDEALMLRQLIDPILEGKAVLGPCIMRINGDVVIRYPKGLSSLGEPGEVLSKLFAAGIILSDPVMPGKKIQTVDGVKAVVLTSALSRAIVAALGEAEAASDPFTTDKSRPNSSNAKKPRQPKSVKDAACTAPSEQSIAAHVPTEQIATTTSPSSEGAEEKGGVPDAGYELYVGATTPINEADLFPEESQVAYVSTLNELPQNNKPAPLANVEEISEDVPEAPRNEKRRRIEETAQIDSNGFAPANLSPEEAIAQLIQMIRDRNGKWLASEVRIENDFYVTSALAMDRMVLEFPHCLSKAKLRFRFVSSRGEIRDGKLFVRTQQ